MMGIGDGFLADTHVHSRFSHDSETALSDICRAAKEKKLGVVCITDHADVKPTSDMEQMAQTRRDVAQAVAEEREKCDGVELLLGIELACGGFYPDHEVFHKEAQMLLDIGHYDCVIGSVHSVGSVSTARNDYSAMDRQALIGCMDRYFDAIMAMLEHGKPDVLAHLTYPLRYINGKYGKGLDWRELEGKIRGILTYLIEHGIALEVNTSCLGTDYDALLPDEEILQMYLQMGGHLLTLGSDAHKPENLGKGFAQAVQRLKAMQVEQLYYVKNRHFCAYKI